MRGRPKKERTESIPSVNVPAAVPALRELEGFRIFEVEPNETDRSAKIGLWINPTTIRLSKGARIALGSPEFVIVFFDELRRRMMLQPADRVSQNRIRLTIKQSGIRCVIQRKALNAEIERISEKGVKGRWWLPGYAAATVQPSLIFPLDDMEARK